MITIPLVLLEWQDWIGQNSAVIIAALALLGSIVTAYMGVRQKRTPTGEAQLDDERQYRLELRSENKDLKAEVQAIETLNDTLTAQNRQLRQENAALATIREQLEAQNKLLLDEKVLRDREIAALKEDIVELNRQIRQLRAMKDPQ